MTKQKAENIIIIIKSLPLSQSRFPKIEDIAKKLNLPKYKTTKLLNELVDLGMLSRTGNWYNFIQDNWEVTEKQAKDYIDAIKESNKKDCYEVGGIINNRNTFTGEGEEVIFPLPEAWQKKLNKFNEKKIGDISVIPIKQKIESFTILRYVMLVIGIGAGIMSAYYTQIWQAETLTVFWSWFLSLIIIGFASAAFLTLIGLITKSIYSKFSTWLLAGIFLLLWLICLIYSIQVTVAGRYNQYKDIMNKNNISQNVLNVNNIKIANILDSIETLKNDRSTNQIRLNTLLMQAKDIQNGKEIKGETWLTIQSRILNVQDILASISKKLESKNIEYEKILSESKVSDNELKFGFYDWAAKVYKTDRSNIEWIFILFPSLFLDIASPIALAVFMFLGRKKEE